MKNIRQKIELATLSLVSAKPLEFINTSEIIEKAGVAKASFYYNFHDKYDAASKVFLDVILSPLKDPQNTSLPWRHRVLSIYNCCMQNLSFVVNLLKYDEPYYIYFDLIKYYEEALGKHLTALGANIENPSIKKGIENLTLCDITFMYRLARNSLKIEDVSIMMKAWFDALPKSIYDYVSK